MILQLHLDVAEGDGEEPLWVAWERQLVLGSVWVVDMGTELEGLPDVYVSYADWGHRKGTLMTPLADLAQMVLNGATVAASPRAPSRSDNDPVCVQVRTLASMQAETAVTGGTRRVRFEDATTSEKRADHAVKQGAAERSATKSGGATQATSGGVHADKHPGDMTDAEFRDAALNRIAPEERETSVGRKTLELMMRYRKVFSRIDVSEVGAVTVGMEIAAEPQRFSWRAPQLSGAKAEAARAGLEAEITNGFAELVPWSEPKFGFVFVVPKPGGKWRVTINPEAVNKATKRVTLAGGYMPESMLQEAMKGGRGCRYAASLDAAQAFKGMKLTEDAQKLSTFASPIGAIRYKVGWFGWHSFPLLFTQAMQERVLLPANDAVPFATIIGWVDDLLSGADTEDDYLAALEQIFRRMLALGWRLELSKCNFLAAILEWCGIELQVKKNEWRVAPSRVASLMETPSPKNRDALLSVLGIIQYYYFSVVNQMAQRARLAKLRELDVAGIRVAEVWTDEHEKALRDALSEITAGNWSLVFDPSKPVYVTTDASGNLGWGVVFFQYDSRTGEMRPIAYKSEGWEPSQLRGWGPQSKEQYARRMAVCVIAPRICPGAEIILLCDNKNLASEGTVSADRRVERWKLEIAEVGGVEKHWIPGEWNLIADVASRSVVPSAETVPIEGRAAMMGLFAMTRRGNAEATLGGGVPDGGPAETQNDYGHLPMAPFTAKILRAQQRASEVERASWVSTQGDRFKYSIATLGGETLQLYNNRLLIPSGETELKGELMKMAHDVTSLHYAATERTAWALINQVGVWWKGIHGDVEQYIRSCFRCQFAKGSHSKNEGVGTLNPTIAPFVHHTWYADFKGPFPGGGHILLVIEAISRFVRLRYVPATSAKELLEEFYEVIISNGTQPRVLRTDNGEPFKSKAFQAWLESKGIRWVPGAPYHSQGQGIAETKFREIGAALIATLGNKAESSWWKGHFLSDIERIVNSTVIEHLGFSPYAVLHGHEPCTELTALTDWARAETERAETERAGTAGISFNQINNFTECYHTIIDSVQQAVSMSTSLAMALTKRRYDETRTTSKVKVGDYVRVHNHAVNKARSWWTGPYKITQFSADGNFAWGLAFVDPVQVEKGPWYVTRLSSPLDMSRTTIAEVVAHQAEGDQFFVQGVKGHRILADGTMEFEVEWFGASKPTTWVSEDAVRRVTKVKEYCGGTGLRAPGSSEWRTVESQRGGRRGRGRGRGRGQ
jgi:hypothetical protein